MYKNGAWEYYTCNAIAHGMILMYMLNWDSAQINTVIPSEFIVSDLFPTEKGGIIEFEGHW